MLQLTSKYPFVSLKIGQAIIDNFEYTTFTFRCSWSTIVLTKPLGPSFPNIKFLALLQSQITFEIVTNLNKEISFCVILIIQIWLITIRLLLDQTTGGAVSVATEFKPKLINGHWYHHLKHLNGYWLPVLPFANSGGLQTLQCKFWLLTKTTPHHKHTGIVFQHSVRMQG